MENKELILDIAKDQISFDFDELLEEESLSIAQPLIKPLSHDYIKDEVLFVVVKAYNNELAPNLPSLELCGKKMVDWVCLAGSCCEQMVIEDCEDIIAKIRNIHTNKHYIALFYSDTPLLDKSSFFKIMDYFAGRSVNFLQLTRGFVVKTEFLKNSPNFIQSATGGSNIVKLLRCDNSYNLSVAYETLNERIVNYHMKNGVTVFGKSTVFIDADVEIDSGVIIYPNNILKGQTIVSSGSVLESGNIIDNSIILNNCHIYSSVIKNSKVTEGVTIEEGNTLNNEVR